MVNFFGVSYAKSLMEALTQIGLEDNAGNQSIFARISKALFGSNDCPNEFTDLFRNNYYIYQPGTTEDVIDVNDSVNFLWLRQIQPNEISLRPILDGQLQVLYQGQPIIRMRGVDLIRTDNGCYSLDYWLKTA